MALAGLLLDLDGTLVDSNGLHARAWTEALASRGYRVGDARIAQEIGKGGDEFVPSLLGGDADEQDGDALRAAHGQAFERLARAEGVKPMPQAEELLRQLRARGLRTALATSAKLAHLEIVEEASGVPWRQLVDAVTHADQVEASKPNPDIVQRALVELGLGPGECALIGDTPWDSLAASRAGVVAIGVASGSNEPRALLRCGARLVYADVAEVLAQLDRVLQLASPCKLRLSPELLENLMREALKEAELSLERGELPVAAVVANGAGKVLGRGRSRWRESGNALAHAELEALHAASGGLDRLARDGILVTTLEPGPMVAAAAIEASLDSIVFAVPAPPEAGARRVVPSETGQRQVCRLVGNVLEAESRRLFQRWVFRADRGREHDPYVDALLGSSPG